MIEFGAAALKIAPGIGAKLAELGFKEAMKKLNPSDFEKACICAIEAADKNKLFSACEQGVVEDFLKSFLTGKALPELLKPFKDQEKPQVKLLVETFKATVPEHKKIQGDSPPEDRLIGWGVLAEHIFRKTVVI